MFEIIGDEIVFEGKTVAKLVIPPGTLRDRVENLLECLSEDMAE